MELHTREWYENYAKENGYELTDKAEKVLNAVSKCYGFCPCRYMIWKKTKSDEEMKQIQCPCIFIEEDMKDNNGNCHCFLFKKKEV